MRSTDSAKTWHYQGYTSLPSSGDMWVVDDTTVIVAGGNGIAKSINAGDSFHIVMYNPNESIRAYTNGIYFTCHDTGFVAYAFDVYKTYDAGDTWTKTDFAFDSVDYGNHINFITATSSQKIIVGCANGNIYKTENGGGIYTGINTVKPNISFALYPNPTTGLLNIRLQNPTDICQVVITDILGKTIYNASPNNNQIDVSALAAGIYLLKLDIDGTTTTAKFVKQ